MTHIEFLEAFARIAEKSSLPPVDSKILIKNIL